MRSVVSRLLPIALSLVVLGPGRAPAGPGADEPDLKGNRKLVLILTNLAEIEVLAFDTGDGGKPQIKAASPVLPGAKIGAFEQKDGQVKLTITSNNGEATFQGVAKGGKVLGTLKFQGSFFAARLEPAENSTLGQKQDRAALGKIIALARDKDPKSQVAKIKDLLTQTPESPTADILYTLLLKAAEPAGLPEKDVRDAIEKWVASAKAYGEEWTRQKRWEATKLVAGMKAYPGLALDLATQVDKEVGTDTSAETRADVVRTLARAARLAGKADVAAEADARLTKLNEDLDKEYHEKVPPFKVAAAGPRKDKEADRVVLFELFTGAQCPPCVAADVAFDALNQTYEPTELITLQYHLHIPGPDPMTNPDTIERQNYYGDSLRATPATYFNGQPQAGGGGSMAGAKAKYDEFRQIIDEALAGKKQATIDLKVDRAGDKLTINATAKALGKDDAGSKLKLRLALIEEQVRYVGGNHLRFHHHVVRALPGGAEGKALTDGQVKVEQVVDLAEVRKKQDEYVTDFGKTSGGFASDPPAIGDQGLKVVAFVQDDQDKGVLHAVIAPADAEKK